MHASLRNVLFTFSIVILKKERFHRNKLFFNKRRRRDKIINKTKKMIVKEEEKEIVNACDVFKAVDSEINFLFRYLMTAFSDVTHLRSCCGLTETRPP